MGAGTPTSEGRVARRNNGRLAAVLVGVVFGMAALAFAAVPAYRVFSEQFGFSGTPKRAESNPGNVIARAITVRFNTDTDPALPWRFAAKQAMMSLKVGEQGSALFEAENRGDHTITGTVTFNVTPLKAAPYFVKTTCFCFTEQVLAAGERAELPVTFFVDPAIDENPNLDDVSTITLSYTFFEKPGSEKPGAEKPGAAYAPEAEKSAHAARQSRISVR